MDGVDTSNTKPVIEERVDERHDEEKANEPLLAINSLETISPANNYKKGTESTTAFASEVKSTGKTTDGTEKLSNPEACEPLLPNDSFETASPANECTNSASAIASDAGIAKKTREKIKSDAEKAANSIPFFQLFRFASSLDFLLMFVASLASIATGAIFPIVVLVVGRLTDSFIEIGGTSGRSESVSSTDSFTELGATFGRSESISNLTYTSLDTSSGINRSSLKFLYIGIFSIILALFRTPFWTLSTDRQINHIRIHFFHSIIHQNIAWFDTHKTGEISNRFLDDVEQIKAGMGQSLEFILKNVSTCIGGLIVGFATSWRLSLVTVLYVAIVILPSIKFTSGLIRKQTLQELDDYGRAGAIAEEALSAIRTVAAFGGQEREWQKYVFCNFCLLWS